ncbi:MAG TPA: hypothetical protein VKZ79_05290 [Alphaproteobacteria bacterium]|nr:hypothetical protein [Alphaproteobacteria bacterium]
MLSALSNPIATALSALQRVDGRVAQDANAIAGGAVDGSGTDSNSGGPLTGALNNPVPPTLQYRQGGDITTSVVDLLAAKTAYKANAEIIKVAAQMSRQTLDVFS